MTSLSDRPPAGNPAHNTSDAGLPLITLAGMPTRVRYTGQGGWPIERERANRELTVGEVYVIERLFIARSSSTVSIAAESGKFVGEYNTAMFDFLTFGIDAGAVVSGGR